MLSIGYAARPQHALTVFSKPAWIFRKSVPRLTQATLFVDMLRKEKQNILLLAGNSYTALGPSRDCPSSASTIKNKLNKFKLNSLHWHTEKYKCARKIVNVPLA